MTLFCETCSTYLGPNTPVCPQCGWTRPAHMRYPGRGKGVWQEPYRLEGYPIGRPVFSHGLILAAWKKGKTAGGLTALDRTGRLRWQIICQEAPLEGILLEGECVYFCTSGMLEGGTVYCCQVNTLKPEGEILWRQDSLALSRAKLAGRALLRQNRLYIPCSDGSILCLDASNGQAVPGWQARVDGEVYWLLALNHSLVAVCRESGRIYQVDAVRGRQDGPPLVLNMRLTCEPLLWKETLVLASEDGRLLKVDLHRQTVQDFAAGLKKVTGQPVMKNGWVLAGSHDHQVYAWNEQGQRVWQSNFASQHAFASSPAANEELLAIGANDGKVYGLDIRSGEKRWEFDSGLGQAVARDVLYHEGVFYIGIYSSNEDRGLLYALPWHLGEYELMAKLFSVRENYLEAASLYALAAHYATKNREALGDAAAGCWIDGGNPQMAVRYWEGLAKPQKAAACWELAAEEMRGKDNPLAAEYVYQASRIYWRLGDFAGEDRCYCEAVELGKWPRLRLKPLNNPLQTVGKPGPLTVRIENIGYTLAQGLHFDVGGSLLEPISFNLLTPLAQDRHDDLSFIIAPTREADHVRVEVSYFGVGRSIPFKSQLDVLVQSTKVTRIKLDDMVKSEVRIVNEGGGELDIETGDMVMSRIEIVTKK